jgi:hypothetical protein
MIDEVALKVISRLEQSYPRVFIVGHDSQHLQTPDRVIHVDLKTYASLISCERCKLIIGSMTGTMQMAAVLSRAERCVVVVNYDDYDIDGINHPVTLGKCIRLSSSKFEFINPSGFLGFINNEEL